MTGQDLCPRAPGSDSEREGSLDETHIPTVRPSQRHEMGTLPLPLRTDTLTCKKKGPAACATWSSRCSRQLLGLRALQREEHQLPGEAALTLGDQGSRRAGRDR